VCYGSIPLKIESTKKRRKQWGRVQQHVENGWPWELTKFDSEFWTYSLLPERFGTLYLASPSLKFPPQYNGGKNNALYKDHCEYSIK
jgi:hypothetical protein